MFLADGDLASAWPYFRMIGEPAEMAAAIDNFTPTDEEAEKTQQVVEVALHEGVNPRRGFDLVLQRYGICTAITTLGQMGNMAEEDRHHATKQLIRSLHRELRERLAYDLEQRKLSVPPSATIAQIMQDYPQLMEDDAYHIDVSHLSSVVQFSTSLPPCDELKLAIDLCEYGKRLSPKFRYNNDPPFENQYADYGILLKTLAGIDVESGLAHFHAKAESTDPDQYGTLAAEVYVNLLARTGRHGEGAKAFAKYLATTDPRRLNCPRLEDLCGAASNFQPLVEAAARRDDLVNYVAGLLQNKASTGQKNGGGGN